jgi:hypothetical protein
MNYIGLLITIALMIYLALGIGRSLRIMRAVSHDLRPQENVEKLALVLVGIFHTLAWFPYWIVAYRNYKKDHANL